jgi:hypothetical protein
MKPAMQYGGAYGNSVKLPAAKGIIKRDINHSK